MDRRLTLLAAIGSLVAVLLLGALIAQDTTPDPPIAPPPVASSVAPSAPAPRATRVQLPRPADVQLPEPPREPPAPAELTPDDRRRMNYAMNDVLIEAREACILPWIDGLEEPLKAEFVLDAVLYDGHLYDVGIRSLDLEMPTSVRDCIADKAWYGDWPSWDLQGELRLQRSVAYRNAAMVR
ncbi:MAG TPA: hypothetical protein ENK18_23840 [Deltaproteobacteria bacterium]|nr:hypothetical protein [Deltaproteobacteria bacterium]